MSSRPYMVSIFLKMKSGDPPAAQLGQHDGCFAPLGGRRVSLVRSGVGFLFPRGPGHAAEVVPSPLPICRGMTECCTHLPQCICNDKITCCPVQNFPSVQKMGEAGKMQKFQSGEGLQAQVYLLFIRATGLKDYGHEDSATRCF